MELVRRWLLIGACLLVCVTVGVGQGQPPPPWRQPGKAGQQITGPDGAPLVWVLAASFAMGSSSDESRYRIVELYATGRIADEQPVHQVTLDGFWIQKMEVTNAQYARFLTEHGSNKDAQGHELLDLADTGCEIGLRDGTYAVAAGREDHPVVEVTWYGAKAYAEHYSMALPTEAQWEYAARGPDGRRFPWGNRWEAGSLCWRYNAGPPSEVFGATSPVKSFPDGASWCGALNMAGNAKEWCRDWYDPHYYAQAPTHNPTGSVTPPGPDDHATRVCRGGGYSDDADECRSGSRSYFPPDQCHDYYGFRCVVNCE